MKLKMRIIDIILFLGIIGCLELLFFGIFTRVIMENESFVLFRPGQIGLQIGVLFFLFGIIGLIGSLIGQKKAKSKIRKVLMWTYIAGFVTTVFYLGAKF